jgi:hypothetical protein
MRRVLWNYELDRDPDHDSRLFLNPDIDKHDLAPIRRLNGGGAAMPGARQARGTIVATC